MTKGQAHGFHSEPPPALHLQQEGRWGSGVGAFHLSRQILPVAEAFSVKDVGTGLQLPFIIEPVGNVQDGGVRPRGQEEEEEQDQGLDYFCLALWDPTLQALGPHTLSSCFCPLDGRLIHLQCLLLGL